MFKYDIYKNDRNISSFFVQGLFSLIPVLKVFLNLESEIDMIRFICKPISDPVVCMVG